MAAKIKLNKRSFAIDFRQDRAILMICIGVALVFWILVKLSQTYTSEKHVKLSFRVPQEQAFTQAPPEDMVIKMEGTGWDLMFEFFSSPSISLQYDLVDRTGINLSRNQLRSDLQDALFSRDLNVTDINYDRLELQLEQKVTRRLPIWLRTDLTLAPEYQLRKPPRTNPDSVSVTGPGSIVDSLLFWETDSLVVTDLKASIETTVPLQVPPPEISLDPRAVQVIIAVEQFTQKSLFVTLDVVNASDSIQIFPRQISVTCVLGISQYDKVTSKDFGFQIDLANADPKAENNSVPIELVRRPDSVRVVQFTPKAAKYFIVQDSVNTSNQEPLQ